MIGTFSAVVYTTPIPRGIILNNFNFEVTGENCSEQTANAELSTGNTITFSGCAIQPTPCHILDANYNVRTTEQRQDIVTIELVSLYPPDVAACIQVIKPTSFRGNFNLESLNFEVNIVYNGETLERFAAIA